MRFLCDRNIKVILCSKMLCSKKLKVETKHYLAKLKEPSTKRIIIVTAILQPKNKIALFGVCIHQRWQRGRPALPSSPVGRSAINNIEVCVTSPLVHHFFRSYISTSLNNTNEMNNLHSQLSKSTQTTSMTLSVSSQIISSLSTSPKQSHYNITP